MLKEPVRLTSLPQTYADKVWQEFQRVHAEFKVQKKIEVNRFREGLAKLEGAEDKLYDDLRTGVLDGLA